MTSQEKARHQAEVMLHFANGGKVENKRISQRDDEYHPCPFPNWDWMGFNYRKAVEPKTVKYLAWEVHSGELRCYREGSVLPADNWTRVPSLDIELKEVVE